MRVLITSILCKSGLMTHVLDLARTLAQNGIDVAIAFRTTRSLQDERFAAWLCRLADISVFAYASPRELHDLCSIFRPHIIHSHSPNCFHSSVTVATKEAIPLIITLHSTFPVQKWYPLTLMIARRIIAVGPAQAGMVPYYQQKTVIIPNGIDLDRFQPKFRPFHGAFRLAWFGRVHGRMAEGVASLNSALQLAQASGAAFKAHLIGSAPGLSKDQFIDEGWLDDPVPLLQETQITFGHGRALREAMACGNIGFLLGAGYGGKVTAELLDELQHLDAFPEYDLPTANPEHLAAEIMHLARHPEQVSELRQQARQIAINHFDVNAMAKATIELYQQALLSSPLALHLLRGEGMQQNIH